MHHSSSSSEDPFLPRKPETGGAVALVVFVRLADYGEDLVDVIVQCLDETVGRVGLLLRVREDPLGQHTRRSPTVRASPPRSCSTCAPLPSSCQSDVWRAADADPLLRKRCEDQPNSGQSVVVQPMERGVAHSGTGREPNRTVARRPLTSRLEERDALQLRDTFNAPESR